MRDFCSILLRQIVILRSGAPREVRNIAFLVMLVSLATLDSLAQSVKSVDGTPFRSGQVLLKNGTGTARKVYINKEKPNVRDMHSNGNNLSVSLDFMQSAWVAQVYPSNSAEPTHFLLARSQDRSTAAEAIGWVASSDLLTQAFPLLAAPGIYKKCLVVNRVDSANAEENSVRLHRSPGIISSTAPNIPVRLNNIFFLYKVTPDGEYALLGTDPQFSDVTRDSILGWAPTARLAYWNTRFGFEWNIPTLQNRPVRKTPGRVFRDIESAKRFPAELESGRTSIIQDHVLFEEGVANLKDRRIPFARREEPRFILMSSNDNANDPTSLQEVAELDGHFLFRVGATGSSNPANIEYRRSLSDMKRSLRSAEIVFLIDKTEEMEPFLLSSDVASPIEQTIREILNEYRQRIGLEGDAQRQLKLSLSFYGDEKYSTVPFVINPLVRIDRIAEIDDQLSVFRSFKRDGGGDAPDSVFSAIERALGLFKGISNERRIIILIGTMGDRLGDNPADLEAKYQSIVSKAIPSSGSFPVEFYAIQADTDQTRAGHIDAKRFRVQIQALVERLNATWKDQVKVDDQIAFLTESRQAKETTLREQIEDRIKRVEQTSAESLTQLDRAAITGNSKEGASTVIGNFLAARLARRGIDPSKTLIDVFEAGYVWRESFDYGKNARIPQVRTLVRVEKVQVENLVRILTELNRPNSYRIGQKRDLDQLSQRVLGNLTGDSFDRGENPGHLSDYLAQRSLPFQSDFMKAITLGKDAVMTPEVIKHLKFVELKLRDVLRNSYCEYVWKAQERDSGEIDSQWTEIPGKRLDVVRTEVIDGDESGEAYVWLDLFEEMP
jgi:hypothetical protein